MSALTADLLATAQRFLASRTRPCTPRQDVDYVYGELLEVEDALAAGDRAHAAHELGDVALAALVAVCQHTDDPARVLGEVLAKVNARIDAAEAVTVR